MSAGTAQAIQALQLQVQALQQQMQQLAAAAQGSEALQPTYLTVSPTGLVSADFSGVVYAAGLTVPAGAGSAGAPNEILWEWTSTGAAVATISNYAGEGTEELELLVGALAQADTSDIQLRVNDDQGTQQAQLILTQTNRGSPAGESFLQAHAGNQQATLLDNAGNSSFLRLLSTQQLQLAYGTATLTWPGASYTSNSLTISHGLGRTPGIYGAICTSTSGAGPIYIAGQGANSSNFQVVGATSGFDPGSSTTTPLNWFAIG